MRTLKQRAFSPLSESPNFLSTPASRTVLNSVSITYNVRYIGEECFKKSNLASVHLPSSLSYLGKGAFSDIPRLTYVKFNSNLTTLLDETFARTGLTSITLPSSLTSMGNKVFYDSNLGTISIPSNVTSIGSESFAFNNLSTINLSSPTLTHVGAGAFKGNKLASITWAASGGITSILQDTFASNNFTKVTIGKNIKNIEEYAFNDNTGLTEITFKGGTSKTVTLKQHALYTSGRGNWFFDKAYTQPFTEGDNPATNLSVGGSDVTIYRSNTVKITEQLNNGEGTKVEHLELYTFPTTPHKEGYIFDGWYTDSALTNKWISSVGVTKSMHLYAKYVPEQYLVTFKMDDGSIIKSEKLDYGSKIEYPSVSKKGHSFDCWENYVEFVPRYDIIVIARFIKNKYRATFLDWDDTVIKSEDIYYDSNIVYPVVSRIGHTFVDWLNKLVKMPDHDATFKAQYEINKHKLTYKDWDGTVLKTIEEVEYGLTLSPPNNPSRVGHTFTGWSYTGTMPDADLEVVAQYQINQYTITFVDWDGTLIRRIQQDYGTPLGANQWQRTA